MLVFMTNFKAFWLIFNLITKTTRDEFQIAFKTVGGISPLKGVTNYNALLGMKVIAMGRRPVW